MVTGDGGSRPPEAQWGPAWVSVPYGAWQPTCDTLHAHTQLLGKLAVTLAPPEPQLQHAALRLTARGWETAPLPAPDGSGALVVLLDLHRHDVVVEHSDGRTHRVPLTPDRPVGQVTREVMAVLERLVGPVRINMVPQEVPWTAPLDEDDEHHTYDAAQVATYFSGATRAAAVLAEVRAPYRGRSSPVNAWWGTFDLAVSLFSGRSTDPASDDFIRRNSAMPSRSRWAGGPATPGTPVRPSTASPPPPPTVSGTGPSRPRRAWDAGLGEFILDWDDVVTAANPHALGVAFGRDLIAHACTLCDWDQALTASAQGVPPPVH